MTRSINGNSHALILQDRDRRLMSELAVFRVIDREQAKRIAGFHSTTRANARLLALTRAGFLKRAFVGTEAGGRKALYSVAPKGALQLGEPIRGLNRPPDAILVGDLFIQHQLDVNTVLLAFRHDPAPEGIQFIRYAVFQEPLAPKARLIPDGYVEITVSGQTRAMFLEVDRGTETSKVWNRKTEGYLELAVSGEFQKKFHHPQFRVLVVAPTARRIESLRRTIRNHTDKIFWLSTLSEIEQHGPFASIWTRPADAEPRPLR